ncbi:MAG TPA: hypothetical protein ENK75_03775 [Saprospiraceae bacterium]|nr:hypothetical protein [Saprospiraceae bacterium]
MKKIASFCIFLFLINVSLLSQEKKAQTNVKNTPQSIYTMLNSVDVNGFSSINKRLQLTSFTYIFQDNKNVGYNYFTVRTENFNKNTYTFLDDDFQRNTLKKFQFKIDPTLWPASYFVYK